MFRKTLLLLLAALLPLSQAVAHDESSPGYWYSSNGTLIHNSYGECWRTSQWSKDNAIRACDPQLFPEKVADKPKPPAQPAPPRVEKPAKPHQMEHFTMPSVLFGFDQAVIRPDYSHDLHHLAMRMKQNPAMKLTLIGHTDSKGSARYNMKLGLKRAQAVARYLQAQGVDASQIKAISAGEGQPVADNATEEGRAKNRRVEFVLDY